MEPVNNSVPNQEEEEAQVLRTNEMFQRAEKVLKAMQTPQAIRELPSFDGNPVKLHAFIRAVENLLPFLDTMKDTPFEEVWLQSIRAKITGDADQVLEIHGTPLKWNEIKANLIAYYNDKRDSVTLTRELFQLQQTGSIEEFYGSVQNVLSLLINHTNISTTNANLRADRTKTHQENALQVFLAGLREPIGGNVRARQPKKLKEAFDACVEERNFQNRFGLNKPEPIRPPKPLMLPGPSKPTQQHFQIPNQQQKFNFKPPQPFKNYQFPNQPQRNYFPAQNFNSRPQVPPRKFPTTFNNAPNVQLRNAFEPRPMQLPKPTPMEVDPSVRSKQINYINRPRVINYHEGEDFYEPYEPHYEYDETHQYYDEAPDTEPIPCISGSAELERNEEVACDTDEINFHLMAEVLRKR